MGRRIPVLGAVCASAAWCVAAGAGAQTDPWSAPSAGQGLKGGLATAGQVSQKAQQDAQKAGGEAMRATSYGVTHPGEVVSKSAHASGITVDETRSGFMEAAESPLRDLNMMQREIPAALIAAERHPYDATGLETCKAITDQVVALDLALGPDVDTPNIEKIRDPYARSASFVASSALDAVKDVTTHILPGRNVVRRLSGANRYDRNVRNAVLAGAVRRGFLKAYGMMRDCDWPAAPIGYQPTHTTMAANGLETQTVGAVGKGPMVVTVSTVVGVPEAAEAASAAVAEETPRRPVAQPLALAPSAQAGAWSIGRPAGGTRR